jgi:Ca2+:H+ antiporter
MPFVQHKYFGDQLPPGKEVSVLLQLSHGSAVILMLMYVPPLSPLPFTNLLLFYVAYVHSQHSPSPDFTNTAPLQLFFQLYSHNHLFLDTCQSCNTSLSSPLSTYHPHGSTISISLPAPVSFSSQEEHLKLSALLLTSTLLTYLTTNHFVASLSGLIAANPSISKEFIMLIVIPVISNAAEHMTAVVVARKGKFDLAMSVAVGSCIQIVLFVVPLLVMVAWGMGKPLTLLFDSLETVVSTALPTHSLLAIVS